MEKHRFKVNTHPSELGEIGSYWKLHPIHVKSFKQDMNLDDLLIFSFYYKDVNLGWICQFYNCTQNIKHSYLLAICNWKFVPYE